MNYLKYIERSAENLQFYLWHRDYTKRFNELPEGERTLSPEWTVEIAEKEALAAQNPRRTDKLSPEAAAVFKGTTFESKTHIDPTQHRENDPFGTPPGTPLTNQRGAVSMDSSHSGDHSISTNKVSIVKKAEGAFEDAGLKWQPCK